MNTKQYYVYMLSNHSKKLYTGVTGNLVKRLYEHKNKLLEGHTSKYNLQKLVYYEIFEEIEQAIIREKQIKGWIRIKKINLIESINLYWEDLYENIL